MTPRELPLRPPEDSAVRLIDLPDGVDGLISEDADGFVNIYINARRSRRVQAEALQHELRHYYRDDLHSDRSIRSVEADGEQTDIAAMVRERLLEVCQICDVAQRPPRMNVNDLRRLASGLKPEHFTPADRALRAHYENGGTLTGAVYLNAHGQPEGAVLMLCVEGGTVTADLGRGLTLRELWREPDGLARERMY